MELKKRIWIHKWQRFYDHHTSEHQCNGKWNIHQKFIVLIIIFSLVWCGVHWQSQHCQPCCSHSWSHSPGAIFWSADYVKFYSLLEWKTIQFLASTSHLLKPRTSCGRQGRWAPWRSCQSTTQTFEERCLWCPFLEPVQTLVEKLNSNLSANLLFSWLAVFPVNSNSSTWPEAFDFISCLQQQKFSHPVSTLFKAGEPSKENPPTSLNQW